MNLMTTIGKAGMAAAGAAFLAAAGLSSAASAVTFDGTYTIDTPASGDGLIVSTAPDSGSLLFDLDVNETLKIGDFFTIWTDEGTVHGGEDTIPLNISVDFVFDTPSSSGSVDGNTVGERVFFGLFQGGNLTWNGPESLAFGDGGLLEISLTDAEFNWGMFGTLPGERFGGTVGAEFTLVSDSAAVVPLPAALPLLLSAFGGLFLFGRRRATATA